MAAVGKTLLECNPGQLEFFANAWTLDRKRTLQLIVFLLAIHDLGKFSVNFQRFAPEIHSMLQPHREKSQRPFPIRHDQMGYRLAVCTDSRWDRWLYPTGTPPQESHRLCSRLRALIAASLCHHGAMPWQTKGFNALSFPTCDRKAAYAFCSAIAQLLALDLDDWEPPKDATLLKKTSFLFAGFAIVCDWLGSNQTYFNYCSDQNLPLHDYWTKTALASAKRAVAETALVPPPIATNGSMRTFFPKYDPTDLQDKADVCDLARAPQLFIVEDLTGSGKTEAALVLAYRLMEAKLANGVFVALPTQATADQMFDRVCDVYANFFQSKASCILAHGQRHLSSKFKTMLGLENPPDEREPAALQQSEEHPPASATCNQWFGDSLKKCLLGSVGVGTVDQVMLGALYVKHQAMRLYGLAGKVLILDEIHAYDTYMLTILCNLLRYHAQMGGSAILLSATLPLGMREKLAASFCGLPDNHSPKLLEPRDVFPEFTQVVAGYPPQLETQTPLEPQEVRQVRFEFLHKAPIEAILDMAASGQCVCWIRNSVMDAIEAYSQLRQHLPQGTITLFHARFPMGQRLAIQETLIDSFGKKSGPEKRRGKVVVATQVVEQSLDVDFDRVISDLAPIDLLLQRLGRQMRHPRSKDGRFKSQGGDERGERLFQVFAPIFEETPSKDWFSRDFPRAAAVYEANHRLWLTQKTLRRKPNIELPRDTRHLIESVYACTEIPEGFTGMEAECRGKGYVDYSRGSGNTVPFHLGYDESRRPPDLDDDALTRLGPPTVTYRIAVWTDDAFLPLPCADGIWEQSQVRVPKYYGEKSIALPGRQADAYETLCQNLPDKNRRVCFLPMVRDGHYWTGQTLNGETPQTIVYHPEFGVIRQEDIPE